MIARARHVCCCSLGFCFPRLLFACLLFRLGFGSLVVCSPVACFACVFFASVLFRLSVVRLTSVRLCFVSPDFRSPVFCFACRLFACALVRLSIVRLGFVLLDCCFACIFVRLGFVVLACCSSWFCFACLLYAWALVRHGIVVCCVLDRVLCFVCCYCVIIVCNRIQTTAKDTTWRTHKRKTTQQTWAAFGPLLPSNFISHQVVAVVATRTKHAKQNPGETTPRRTEDKRN